MFREGLPVLDVHYDDDSHAGDRNCSACYDKDTVRDVVRSVI